MGIKERIDKVAKLVERFNDGELSYQGLDNELHNLYAEQQTALLKEGYENNILVSSNMVSLVRFFILVTVKD